MPNYNRITIIGHLGKAPENKSTNAGNNFIAFSVAVTEYKKKADGNFDSITTWFDCTCWDKFIAEKIQRASLQKGYAVMVSGAVSARAYLSSDGIPKASVQINVKEFVSLDRNQNAQQGGQQYAGANPYSQQQLQPADGLQQGEYDPEDDDLPF